MQSTWRFHTFSRVRCPSQCCDIVFVSVDCVWFGCIDYAEWFDKSVQLTNSLPTTPYTGNTHHTINTIYTFLLIYRINYRNQIDSLASTQTSNFSTTKQFSIFLFFCVFIWFDSVISIIITWCDWRNTLIENMPLNAFKISKWCRLYHMLPFNQIEQTTN